MSAGAIRVGIGGWDFDPWRGTFYPPGLAKAKQLEHASRQLSAIEINATYYRTQSPALFERWAKTVPDGFKFAVKASRFCTTRQDPGGRRGERRALFCGQGLTALGDRLGPILWQFMATKKFDARRFRRLPEAAAGEAGRGAAPACDRGRGTKASAIRPSWRCAARRASRSSSATAPIIRWCRTSSGGIVYARLMRARGGDRAGLSAGRARPVGGGGAAMGGGRKPRRLSLCRRSGAGAAARHLRLLHRRGEGAEPGGGEGSDRAAEMNSLSRLRERVGVRAVVQASPSRFAGPSLSRERERG